MLVQSDKLRPGVVPDVLRDIYVCRRTGFLRFTRDGHRCEFRVRNGHIVYGQATLPELRLGECMVEAGLLSQAVLDRATGIVTAENLRLGEVLLGLGLDEAQVGHGLGLHVRRMLVHVFAWREGAYAFEERDEDEVDAALPISTGEMILEAVRVIEDPDAVAYALGDLDRTLLPATDPLLRFQHVTLSAVDGYVLSRVDGVLSAREVMQLIPLPGPAVEKSLFALLCIGVVEYATTARRQRAQPSTAQFLRQEILDLYASLGRRTPFEMLNVASISSDAEIKAAYFRLAKRFHPDVHHEQGLSDLRDKLEAIFFKLHDAYEAISTDDARAEYLNLHSSLAPAATQASSSAPASGAKAEKPAAAAAPAKPARPPGHRTGRFAVLSADDLYRKAEERFAEARYWEAVALLNEAIGLAENRLKLRARLLLARAYLKSPDFVKHAERELQAVLQEDGENVEAAYLLGTIYRRSNLNLRAAGMFRRVLALRPNHREARAELDSLDVDPAAEIPAEGPVKHVLGRLIPASGDRLKRG